jgi:Holliday junction DNA helicase RuvA
MNMYGFSNKETRDIFQILLSVSGVGAKMAIALLNEFDACDLITFVIDGDFKELTRAKGVGPKLAQKIILELKDKLMKTDLPRTACPLPQSQAMTDAQMVMLSLGYDDKEVEDALTRVISTLEDDSNPEEILRKALTCLSM